MDGGLHGRGGGRRDDGRRAGHVAGRAAGAARSTLNSELCSFSCSRDWRADRRRVASHMHVKRGDGGIRAGTRRIWGVGVCVEGGRRGEAGGRVPGAAAVESRVHSVATHIALIHMSRIKPKIWWGGGRRPWGLYQCLHRARPHHIFGVAPCVDTGTLVSMRSVSKYSFFPTDRPAGRFPPQSPPAERASVDDLHPSGRAHPSGRHVPSRSSGAGSSPAAGEPPLVASSVLGLDGRRLGGEHVDKGAPGPVLPESQGSLPQGATHCA